MHFLLHLITLLLLISAYKCDLVSEKYELSDEKLSTVYLTDTSLISNTETERLVDDATSVTSSFSITPNKVITMTSIQSNIGSDSVEVSTEPTIEIISFEVIENKEALEFLTDKVLDFTIKPESTTISTLTTTLTTTAVSTTKTTTTSTTTTTTTTTSTTTSTTTTTSTSTTRSITTPSTTAKIFEGKLMKSEEIQKIANCDVDCEFGYKTDLFGKTLCACYNPCGENKCGNKICIIKHVDDKYRGICYDPKKIERPLKCHMPLVKGSCREYSSKYYYNSLQKKCVHFVYRGCNGNENNFDSFNKCHLACNTCSLPASSGPCRGNMIRYYYDQSSQACTAFNYGGCLGNGNNFESKKECEESCL